MAATTEIEPGPDMERLAADAADVADSRSAASFAVQEIGWKDVAPALPDEVIALLAPPVVVTAEAVRPASQSEGP